MATLKECQNELNSIIKELEAIEDGIRADFSGIGEKNCADCISVIVSKYRSVKKSLDNVDTNKIADALNGEE